MTAHDAMRPTDTGSGSPVEPRPRRRPVRRSPSRAGLAIATTAALLLTACASSDDSADGPVATNDGGAQVDGSGAGVVTAETTTDEVATSEGPPTTADDGGDEPAGDPTPGGTLRYGLEADVDGLNPTSSALSAPGLTMGNAVFDTLAAQTADGEFVPYLAESIEPSDDFRVWTVTIRQGVSFHDGTPLDADAVVRNFETQLADPLVGLAVRPFYPEQGATTIVDEFTVQYNLLEGNRYFPGALASQLGMVASPTWLDAALADPTLNQQPVGTGPFVFDSRSPDSVSRFVRNDDWWNGAVYLDALEFLPVTDPDTRNDLLFAGELDAVQASDPAAVEALQADDAIQSVVDPSGEESFAMLNTSVPPFDDLRARRALALASPLDNYRQLIGLGTALPADGPFEPTSPFHDPDVVQEGDDPEAAAALVAEYCDERGSEVNPVLEMPTCSDGRINVELQWPGPSVTQDRIGDLLDEGWEAGGFNVEFQILAQDEHIQQTALGRYNAVTWRQFGADDPSLDNVWLLCRTIGSISLNWPRSCDEERDALLVYAQLLDNGPERNELYQEVSRKLNAAYVYIFFLHTPSNTAFADDVRGMCDRTAPTGELLTCATSGRNWFSSAYFA